MIPTLPITFRIPVKLRAQVKLMAKMDDRTITSVVVQALQEIVERRKAKAPRRIS